MLRCLVIGAALLALLAPAASAQRRKRPKKDKGPLRPVVTAGLVNHPWTLGPTGARGWEDLSAEAEVDGSGTGRHLMRITSVMPGSPAEGKLEAGDVIVKVAGKALSDMPRKDIGLAIGAAEAGSGSLALSIERDGEPREVTLALAKLGAYAKGWPAKCPKSAKILAKAAAWVRAEQRPNGSWSGLGGELRTVMSGLLLLGTGEPEHLMAARRAAHQIAAKKLGTNGLVMWGWSFGLVYLCEYYQATGDATVMPAIQARVDLLVRYQMPIGTWGHCAPANGYKELNIVGVVCMLGLAEAIECGAKVDPAAVQRATSFFAKVQDTGWIPYGEGPAQRGNNGGGRTACATAAFAILGKRYETTVGKLAARVAASFDYRDDCHTGSFFGILWGPCGAVWATPDARDRFFAKQAWYYDLSRRWDGTFVVQSNVEDRHEGRPLRYLGMGPSFSTAGIALAYLSRHRELRMLGAPKGPFARGRPEILDDAAKLVASGEYRSAQSKLKRLLKRKKDPLDATTRQLAQRLELIAKRGEASLKLVLKGLPKLLAGGREALADSQLSVLDRVADRRTKARLAAFRKRLSERGIKQAGDQARRVLDARATARKNAREWQGDDGKQREARDRLKLVAEDSKHPWAKTAKQALTLVPDWIDRRWQPLLAMRKDIERDEKAKAKDKNWKPAPPIPGLKLEGWRFQTAKEGPKGWETPAFDDTSWTAAKLPIGNSETARSSWTAARCRLRGRFRVGGAWRQLRLRLACSGPARVYLNGTLVAVLRSSTGAKNAHTVLIELGPRASALLTRKDNLLAVEGEAFSSLHHLELGLDGLAAGR